MASHPSLSRLYVAGTGLRFSYAILLALAANFIWASGHDQQRCIELVVLCAALAWALASGRVTRAVQAVPAVPRALCLAFLALGAAASVGVVSPYHALAEWSMFALLGLAALVIAAEIAAAGTPGLFQLLQLLGLVCALYSLRVLLMFIAGMAARVQLDFHALAVGFSNARFLNHAQTALLPLLVLLTRPAVRTRIPAKVFFMVAAFWWSLIFVSEARATMLALLAGGAAALTLRRGAAKAWLLTMAATAMGGLVLYVVLYFALPWAFGMSALGAPDNLITRSAADPASGRQFLWKRAFELIVQHPLLGVGPQHFAHYGQDIYIGAHPHDWLFQIGAEWGVPALACLVAVLLLGTRALSAAAARIGAADLLRQHIATTFIVAITAIAVDGLFSGVLVMPQSQLAIALVAGMAIGWVRSLQAASLPVVTPVTRCLSLLAGGLALAIAAAIIGPDLGRKWQDAPLDVGEQLHNPAARWPRLWGAGYF
jgi:O-antigen ligase